MGQKTHVSTLGQCNEGEHSVPGKYDNAVCVCVCGRHRSHPRQVACSVGRLRARRIEPGGLGGLDAMPTYLLTFRVVPPPPEITRWDAAVSCRDCLLLCTAHVACSLRLC